MLDVGFWMWWCEVSVERHIVVYFDFLGTLYLICFPQIAQMMQIFSSHLKSKPAPYPYSFSLKNAVAHHSTGA